MDFCFFGTWTWAQDLEFCGSAVLCWGRGRQHTQSAKPKFRQRKEGKRRGRKEPLGFLRAKREGVGAQKAVWLGPLLTPAMLDGQAGRRVGSKEVPHFCSCVVLAPSPGQDSEACATC